MTLLQAEAPSQQNTARPAPLQDERALWRARDLELLQLRQADPQAGLAAAKRWLSEVQPASEAEAWAVRAYAQALRSADEYREAVAHYELAEHLFDRLGLATEVARTGLGHVWALRLLGRYDEAIRLGLHTRRFFRARGELLEAAKQTNNLGTVYRRMGRLEAARRSWLGAARDFRRCGDLMEEATAVSHLSNVLADLGRYGEAEWAQRRAIRLYTQLKQ